MGVDFELDLRPGGAMTWSGLGKDGKPVRYVTGEVLRVEPLKLFEYKFGMGSGAVMSRVKVELTPETEAVRVVVTNDEWQEDDPAYAQNAESRDPQHEYGPKASGQNLMSIRFFFGMLTWLPI